MGYIKSGSQKSLAAGGLSALLLYYVHTQLPIRPAFASALGLGYDSCSAPSVIKLLLCYLNYRDNFDLLFRFICCTSSSYGFSL